MIRSVYPILHLTLFIVSSPPKLADSAVFPSPIHQAKADAVSLSATWSASHAEESSPVSSEVKVSVDCLCSGSG